MGMQKKSLEEYGWSPFYEKQLSELVESAERKATGELIPGRIVFAAREIYRAATERGELLCRAVSRLMDAGRASPAIGDWVLVETLDGNEGRVHNVFERKSLISRKAAGEETREQVVAANVDSVFIVMGLDGDYNLRRLERFVVVAHESGAEPVVILTKRDLCDGVEERRIDAMGVAPGVPVVAVSSTLGEGLEPLAFYTEPGATVALIGSSGAGKSTLINQLAGTEVMRTGEVREGDDRGRHTTTHRQLLRLPGGALIIDNPGVREVQLWAGADSVDEAFEDVAGFATSCRFRNCSHTDEPGCGVLEAVESGALDRSRFESFVSLRKEQKFLALKQDDVARRQADRKLGAFYRTVQAEKKRRR